MLKRLSNMIIMLFVVLAFSVPVSAATVRMSYTSKTVHLGKSYYLELVNYKAGATKWSCSNTKIATIKKVSASKYKVTGKNTGNATIQCIIGNTIYRSKVTVKAHAYTKSTITKPATCTERGEKTSVCSCGVKKITAIAALGHNMTDAETLKEPTCTEAGLSVSHCKNCEYKENIVIPALGHDYVVKTEDPTCLKSGKAYQVCTRCESIINETTIPALGHSYVNHICTRCKNKDAQGKFMDQLNRIGNIMVNERWSYSNHNNAKTFAAARKQKDSNCATYVSYALQEAGVLSPGQIFFSGTTGKLSASETLKNNLKKAGYQVITYSSGKSIDNAKLQPGDIVLWKAHTNVYRGKDSSGNPTWYDAGKNSTDTRKEGGRYIKYKRTGRGFTSDNKVYGVIRYMNN